MPTAELHFFDADDPNGSTIFECSTDDEFVKQIKLDIQRDSLGNGLVNFARKVPIGLFSRDIVVPETLVRVLIPAVHATKYYSGFWINPRQQQVVSLDEKGGEGFTFAGPGPKHYLTRMLLWSASFSGIPSAVEKDSGVWTWPETAVAGRILERLFQEDAANPSGPFLPDITLSFDENDDSDGVPWSENISDSNDDFTLRIQQDYLKLLWQIEDASGITSQIYLGEVGDPQIRLDAFQTFGRDLTDDVAFVEGHNIRDDLEVEGSSYRKASHALVRGNDGHYELAIKPSWSPGDLKKVMAVQYDSDSAGILDNAGVRALQRQDNGEKQIDLRIVTGFAPTQGRYFPGPDYAGSNGDFWVGDTVSLTTGQAAPTELDYQDEPQTVTGIEIELGEAVRDDNDERRARSFDVTVNLNEERKSSNNSQDLAGNRGTVEAPPQVLKLCKPITVVEGTASRLYFTNNSTTQYDIDSIWDGSPGGDSASVLSLTTTGSATGGNQSNDAVNLAAGRYHNQQYSLPLSNAGLLAIVQAGGTFRMQMLGESRHGVGINEALQNNFHSLSIRVMSGISTLRGQMVDPDDVTGTVKFPASATQANRSILGDFTAVPSAISTDQLVVETGWNHVGPTSGGTGASFFPNDSEASDLPEDDTTTATSFNSWLDLLSAGSASSGSGHADLVGSSARVSRCDHRHDVHRDRGPGPTDSDPLYPLGTMWAQLDSLTAPTEILGVWMLVDATEGAGIWLPMFSTEDVEFALSNLTDVDPDLAPADGEVLTYDGTLGYWVAAEPAAPSTAGGHILIQSQPAGSPLVFTDLLQNSEGTDLLYADEA